MTTPYPQAARGLLRDTVLDAVDDLVRARGWSATTMAHVAKAAGVSRQTVYNEFSSRAGLVEAYATREIAGLVTQVSEEVRANADDAHRALRLAFALFLKLASDEPVVMLIVGNAAADQHIDADSGELQRLLTTFGREVAAATIAELIPQLWTQVDPGDAAVLADTLVRLAISHALAPDDDPGSTADAVGRLLAPYVDQLLAG